MSDRSSVERHNTLGARRQALRGVLLGLRKGIGYVLNCSISTSPSEIPPDLELSTIA